MARGAKEDVRLVDVYVGWRGKIEGVGSTTNEALAEKFDEFFHLCFPNAPTAEKTPDE